MFLILKCTNQIYTERSLEKCINNTYKSADYFFKKILILCRAKKFELQKKQKNPRGFKLVACRWPIKSFPKFAPKGFTKAVRATVQQARGWNQALAVAPARGLGIEPTLSLPSLGVELIFLSQSCSKEKLREVVVPKGSKKGEERTHCSKVPHSGCGQW